MHYQRLWGYSEYVLLFLLAIVALIDTTAFFISYLAAFALIIFGRIKRKNIFTNMKRDADKIGLKRIGLIKVKETESEVWYEVHVLPPERPITSNGYQIIKEFIKDIPRLYEYARSHDKDVIYYGTSHDTFTKAWLKDWGRLGVHDHADGKNADPLAPYSSWQQTMKRFYRGKIAKMPDKVEWRTTYTRIERMIQSGSKRI